MALPEAFRLLHFDFRRVADGRPVVDHRRRLRDDNLSLDGNRTNRCRPAGRVFHHDDLLRLSFGGADPQTVPLGRRLPREVDGHALQTATCALLHLRE